MGTATQDETAIMMMHNCNHQSFSTIQSDLTRGTEQGVCLSNREDKKVKQNAQWVPSR
ncbi:hypothetical protein WN944_000078 [Citrus x changshan-huyou]|uniref:Uncharacterized protein n=1 Tax=Citrus x changshan-huyou TaxID=2935761 RepID=A0AAP0QPB8_9ROSI